MNKSLLAILIFQLCLFNVHAQLRTFYVSPSGNDVHPIGTLAMPFKTIEAALSHISTEKEKQIVILLRKGTYYLDTTLVLSNSFLQNHSLTIASYKNENVIISGTRRLTLEWKPYRNNILQSYVGKSLQIDHLYYNGKALPMARYPNYDENARVFNGTAEDATSKERVKKWSNPVGGYVHALHQGEWGSFHYLITGVNANGELQLTGGWQMNKPAPMHKSFRFVENIFEELDARGEWYYNKQEGILYFYPLKNINTLSPRFEYSVLNELIAFKGSAENPVKNITINGIRFTGTNRTFMLTKEPIARSDWAVYRGGAILLDGTKHIKITNCHFEALGGNAIFVSNYNRNDTISGNEIYDIGSSAILFMGSQEAIRRPAFKDDHIVPINKMDMEPGPKTNNYPAQCIAYDNLIHDIGRIEKQVAGVGIDMASEITVSHNTIYRVPRSGINIGDGCWGGISLNLMMFFIQCLKPVTMVLLTHGVGTGIGDLK